MIRVLDQHTIDKIAAGEVIERPASVVKELVENSIDAEATRITIEIEDGGKSMIRVTDNGKGIDKEDVRKAYLSHATSKLDNADDLVGIMTLGFRGEALSTIAAVSQTEMITKTPESLTGIRYEIHGGKEIEYKEIGAPDGTTIIVRNLFYNTPARLKFLKSNMTEGSYINDLMSHVALANPEIAIKLISNGKTVIDTNGNNKVQETIYALFGKDIAKSVLPVDYSEGDITITGYTGKPFLSKGNRSFEYYYINKRYIKNAVINRAIEEAYKTYVMQHRFPFTVLYLDMPPESCDVNVHPAKREFRYDNEKELFSAVYHSVADALKEKELIPDAEADYKQRQKIYTPVNTPQSEMHNTQTEIHSNLQPDFHNNIQPEVHNNTKPEIQSNIQPDIHNPQPARPVQNNINYSFSNNKTSSYSVLENILPEEYRQKFFGNNDEGTNDVVQESYHQETLVETGYLSEESIKDYKVLGLAFNTYWITEYDGNLFLMDQHAAHEKVNYETFLAEFKSRKVVSQQIFPPVIINLSSQEKTAVMENSDIIARYGFEMEDFGDNDVKLSALPSNLIGLDGKDIFLELASYLVNDIKNITEDIFVRKLATMGCKAAVKGNQRISEEEARYLIEKLMTLDNPYTCPHGRPTMIKISKDELDSKFKRIVD